MKRKVLWLVLITGMVLGTAALAWPEENKITARLEGAILNVVPTLKPWLGDNAPDGLAIEVSDSAFLSAPDITIAVTPGKFVIFVTEDTKLFRSYDISNDFQNVRHQMFSTKYLEPMTPQDIAIGSTLWSWSQSWSNKATGDYREVTKNFYIITRPTTRAIEYLKTKGVEVEVYQRVSLKGNIIRVRNERDYLVWLKSQKEYFDKEYEVYYERYQEISDNIKLFKLKSPLEVNDLRNGIYTEVSTKETYPITLKAVKVGDLLLNPLEPFWVFSPETIIIASPASPWKASPWKASPVLSYDTSHYISFARILRVNVENNFLIVSKGKIIEINIARWTPILRKICPHDPTIRSSAAWIQIPITIADLKVDDHIRISVNKNTPGIEDKFEIDGGNIEIELISFDEWRDQPDLVSSSPLAKPLTKEEYVEVFKNYMKLVEQNPSPEYFVGVQHALLTMERGSCFNLLENWIERLGQSWKSTIDIEGSCTKKWWLIQLCCWAVYYHRYSPGQREINTEGEHGWEREGIWLAEKMISYTSTDDYYLWSAHKGANFDGGGSKKWYYLWKAICDEGCLPSFYGPCFTFLIDESIPKETVPAVIKGFQQVEEVGQGGINFIQTSSSDADIDIKIRRATPSEEKEHLSYGCVAWSKIGVPTDIVITTPVLNNTAPHGTLGTLGTIIHEIKHAIGLPHDFIDDLGLGSDWQGHDFIPQAAWSKEYPCLTIRDVNTIRLIYPPAEIEKPLLLESRITKGDVDDSGQVTKEDALLVAQYSVRAIEFLPEQQKAADVSGDGKISSWDACLILKYAAGIIKEFPVAGAPALTDKTETQLLAEAIAELERIGLTPEQKQVLEQIKKLLFAQVPKQTALLQNFPNPFNPETWIPYQLAQDAPVTISIYNAKGQLVRKLDLGSRNAGIYATKEKAAYWDGRDDFDEKVASGVYFYTIQAGSFQATKRMVILK